MVLLQRRILSIDGTRQWNKSEKGFTLEVGKTDKAVQEWAQAQRTPQSDKIASIVKPLGELRFTVPVLAALYFYDRARRVKGSICNRCYKWCVKKSYTS